MALDLEQGRTPAAVSGAGDEDEGTHWISPMGTIVVSRKPILCEVKQGEDCCMTKSTLLRLALTAALALGTMSVAAGGQRGANGKAQSANSSAHSKDRPVAAADEKTSPPPNSKILKKISDTAQQITPNLK
jgi:hypothetical protein